jgi:hypothetical protein
MSSNIISYLKSLDWPSLQVLFAMGYCKNDVDDTINMAQGLCQSTLRLIQTRCLFSTNLAAHLLNAHDKWRFIDFNDIDINKNIAINIEIDVTQRLDHMFVLVRIDGRWYIIQSYVNEYTAIIEPIDIAEFLQTVRKWRLYGVNPLEWKKYFHADMPSMNRALPHVYVVDSIYPSAIHSNIQDLSKRINLLYKNKGSYIYNPEYKCIMNDYVDK